MAETTARFRPLATKPSMIEADAGLAASAPDR